MAINASGILCYGILCMPAAVLPWEREELAQEAWWHARGMHPARPPVEVVQLGSAFAPRVVLAVPGTRQTAARGNPLALDPALQRGQPLPVAGRVLKDFVYTYQIPILGEPCWYLGSYLDWGQ